MQFIYHTIYYLKCRIHHLFSRELIMTSLLLVLLTFSLFSYRMNLINHRIDEVLFEESGVKFVVYGDANSLYGFANGEKEYRSINEAIEEIVDDMVEIIRQQHLHRRRESVARAFPFFQKDLLCR